MTRRFAVAVAATFWLGVAGLTGTSWAADHVVTIRDSMFMPETLRIKAGDTVRWENHEKRTSHSVLFKEPTSFESERMFPGEHYSQRFDKPGRVVYSCGPHPEMRGIIDISE